MDGADCKSPSGAFRCVPHLRHSQGAPAELFDGNGTTRTGVEREPDPDPIVAYIRVSSPSQDYAYQRHAIEAAASARGELVSRWFGDVASGRSMDRPELGRLRRQLAKGDIKRVWVWRLDRLSRSGIADTLECVSAIRSAGAALSSVADGFALDTGPVGELVLAVMAWAAQMEREKIRENQHAARARMEREGRPWGRPPLADSVRRAVAALEGTKTPGEIARELKISKSSVHKIFRAKSR
jgi:DNA invertase Pin-like site-specific DNA recombinase